MEFSCLLKKYHVEFQYSKFSFLILELPRGITQFYGICKVKLSFVHNFQGQSDKPKNSRVSIFRKSMSSNLLS